jgi:hypothetical protein
MVGDHHERFDGTGYPCRQARDEITLGGRIVAVADTLDSILSDRPYSKGKPLPWALEELHRCAGQHFDPQVVAALERVVAARGTDFFVPGRAADSQPGSLISLTPSRPSGLPGPDGTAAMAAEDAALPVLANSATAPTPAGRGAATITTG